MAPPVDAGALVIEFELPGLPATANGRRRMAHWVQASKESNRWKNDVYFKLLEINKRPRRPMHQARLHLIRHSSSEPDFDGLVSSFKPIIDGLVLSGVLVNDRSANIAQPHYHWEYAPAKAGKITVRVYEVAESNKAA